MGLLDGKVAVVTGAGRGVGRAEALALAKEGARVVVNDLGAGVDGTGKQAMVADEVVAEIVEAGGQAVANHSNIASLDGADEVMWAAVSKFGRLDILVNNAGILRDKSLLNMTEDDWDLVHKVHTKGTFLCTRAAGRIMKAQGTSGVIINTTSMSGLIGNFGQSNYGFAKSGIYGFTKIAAMELGRYGIRVHAVSPNAVTRMTKDLPALQGVTEERLSPEAMSPLIVYLVSDLARELNGRVIGVHGGTLGTKVYEFKMAASTGYTKKDGLPTPMEISEHIGEALIHHPDLDMASIMS